MKITKTSKIELHKFNLAVIGMSKTGKTHLTSTIKGKPLLCNVDKGALTLADYPIDSVEILNYKDFIDFMKYVTSSDHFVKSGFDWVVFDSVSAIADLLKKHLTESGFTGFDFWGEYLKIMGGLMTTTRDTNRFNSLSIYEVAEKENKNGLLEKKFGLEGSIKDKVPYYYDFVFASNVINKKDKDPQYVLRTLKGDGYDFLGGRGSNKLNQFEPANINHVINKLKGVKK